MWCLDMIFYASIFALWSTLCFIAGGFVSYRQREGLWPWKAEAE